jgi:hypothetical protein
MSIERLEQRLAAVEQQLAAIERGERVLPIGGPDPKSQWWEKIEPLPVELTEAFNDMAAYGRYFRVTGQDAPLEWKPGDPIPDPVGLG